ncbi:MAG: hypothetical protein EP312_01630 [Gammaproteobacteria bacterium]|nr:MAG: hypothetical protein EP312_01630 [Gammaproteobacteria bacterium]
MAAQPAPERIVVKYDPKRRQRRRLLFVVSIVLSVLLGYWLGDAQLLMQLKERYRMGQKVSALQEDVAKARGELAAAQLTLSIERDSAESLRRSIMELQDHVEGLQQEINFYQGLMAPEERQRGLGVRSLEFIPTENPRVYDYVLVLQQLAEPHNSVSGKVQLEVVGRIDGQPETLEWIELAPQGAFSGLPFRFRYFQNLEERLTLPAGFLPEAVLVTVSAKGNNIEQKLAWRLRGGR